jgi:uncharacterized Zn finger protein (UPF0148 family)
LVICGGQIWCPACDIQCILEGQTVPPPEPAAAVEEAKHHEEDSNNDELPPISAEYAEWQKKREKVSAELGTRMLAGWAMLAESCPEPGCRGTPLMRKKGGPMVCVCCDKSYSMDENGELQAIQDANTEAGASAPRNATNGAANPKPAAASAPTTTASSTADRVQKPKQLPPNSPIHDQRRAAAAQSQPKTVDVSQLMAEKLLLGWAMLNETCNQPGCSGEAPLMRDHARRKHCLICGAITDSDGRAAAAIATPAAAAAVAPAAKETKSPTPEEKRPAETSKPEAPAPEPPRFAQSPVQTDARRTSAQPRTETAATSQRISAATPADLGEDIQAILQEISRSTAKLATVAHPSEGIPLAEYIAKLADAAAAMHRLQSQLTKFE